MGKYFLIKEQIYTDGTKEKKDISVIYNGVVLDNYNEALNEAKKYLYHSTDIVCVVEIVAKLFGNLKIKGDGNVKT